MGTPAPRIVCAAVTSLSDQLTIDLEETLCRQSTHSTSRLLLQDVDSIFLFPSIWHPLFQVVRSTVCSPPYCASSCLSDVEVVASAAFPPEEIQDELCNGVSDVRLQSKDAPQAQGANAQGTVL